MTISTIDLSYENQLLKQAFFQQFSELYDSNQLQAGPVLDECAKAFARACGTQFASLTGSGTMSLHVAAKAIGIEPGDEVVVPANTFVATATALYHAGAKIILADVDPNSFVITRDTVEKVLSPATKAIVAVHLYGRIVDVDSLMALGLPVIEDAAHAFGGLIGDKSVGELSDIAAFSTAPIKSLGALGHSGVITYNQPEYHNYIEAYINNGQRQRHIAEVPGHNFRMDNINALFLSLKLAAWPNLDKRRKSVKAIYDDYFAQADIAVQHQLPGSIPSLWVYVIKLNAAYRDRVLEELRKNDINCLVQYTTTINNMPVWPEIAASSGQVDVAIAEQLCKQIISLPVHAGISEEQAHWVAEQVVKAVHQYGT